MQPKTILQKKVAELSLSLPKITEEQTNYAFMKYFKKYVVLSRKSLYCLECGHVWHPTDSILFSTLLGETCPCCNTKLTLYKRYEGSLLDSYYYSIITSHKGMQVVRMFNVHQYMRKKQKASYSIHEVMQHWIDEKGKTVSRSISTSSYGWNGIQWSYGSAMEVKPTSFKGSGAYSISSKITYPRKSILPIIKRNGYKGTFHGFNANYFFSTILSDKKAETLLKTEQIELFCDRLGYPQQVEQTWPQIKLCIRNKYIVKKPRDWFDYINLLDVFGKDILSPKYVCPENLNKEHDRYVKKKQEIDRKKRIEERKAQVEADEKAFLAKKKRFSGLKFEENGITIKFLETVEDIMLEGEAHGHCVFTNEYHKKKDSLIMSARIDHKPIETIEVSLSRLSVVQSRGGHNKATQYHDQIVDIVNRNMKLIQKRLKQKIAV